jgi:hypothetical protein
MLIGILLVIQKVPEATSLEYKKFELVVRFTYVPLQLADEKSEVSCVCTEHRKNNLNLS